MKIKVKLSFAIFAFVFQAVSSYADPIDTKTNIINFFKLSQNDFEINSKSTNKDEQKTYKEFKKADVDDKNSDGIITYSEYLTYLNKNTPNCISAFDFALSKILPFVTDFKFIDDATFLASGITSSPITVQAGFVIPSGTKISLFKFPGFRVNAATDFTVNGVSVHSGGDTPFEVYFVEDKGFFPGQFQISKDSLIDGVPCRGGRVDVWDVNISLFLTGQVNRAILSGDYSANDITFFADEKIQCNDQGNVDAALLLYNRIIQGHPVVAVNLQDLDLRAKGFWGGQAPNIFFENGLVKICYENNKVIDGVSIPGIQAYFYDAAGAVTGITPLNTFFLGYPVAMQLAKPSWDWSIPQPTVTIANGQATFALDVSVQIEAGSKKVVLPEGAIVTIDMATGFCLAVKLPSNTSLAYTVKDKMSPIQVPVDQQSAQILRWAEQWLTAHPEAKDGSNKDIRQAHIQVRDQMLVLEKKVAQVALCTKCLNTVLIYKDKSKGLILGNIAFDFNGDGKIQDTELIPATLREPDTTLFSTEKLFTYLVDNATRLPKTSLASLGKIMTTLTIASTTDDLGVFDKLGSVLSKVGVHPFAAKKIYYFPNGSGDKALCRNIELYPSGMPKKIKLVSPQKDDPPLRVSIPSQAEKLEIWLYGDERLEKENPGNKQNNGYWHDANEVEFWESGSLRRIGNFPYAMILLPPEYGSVLNPVETHNILWTKEGKVYQLVQAGNDTPGNSFILSDKMRIGYFYSITWMNIPQCKIAIGLENAIAVDLFFKKGTYTLYNEDPKSKQLVSYTKIFDNDTEIKVIGGFWVNAKGEITRYWGEYKK